MARNLLKPFGGGFCPPSTFGPERAQGNRTHAVRDIKKLHTDREISVQGMGPHAVARVQRQECQPQARRPPVRDDAV